MAEVIIAEIDVKKLSRPALKVLRAALIYGFENSEATYHAVTLADFCRLAGLPAMDHNEIIPHLESAHKALGILDIFDTEAPDMESSVLGSWQLLQDVGVKGNEIVFQLYRFTYLDVIRATLSSGLLSNPSGEIAREY